MVDFSIKVKTEEFYHFWLERYSKRTKRPFIFEWTVGSEQNKTLSIIAYAPDIMSYTIVKTRTL